MQKLNVHFVNRGWGTNEGEHTVEVFGTGLCDYTSKPLAEIRSPFGLKDNRLTAQYEGNKWVCDLD